MRLLVVRHVQIRLHIQKEYKIEAAPSFYLTDGAVLG